MMAQCFYLNQMPRKRESTQRSLLTLTSWAESKRATIKRYRPNPDIALTVVLITGGTEFFELAKAYFERPSTPGGAIFGVEMRPNLPSDDTLFERVPKLAQMMGNLISHTRTLRRRERPLAGLDGQEMLTQISANGVTAYYFIWEAKGAPDSVIHPNTHIELRIGGEHNKQTNRRESSALSEEDALVLWDIMLNSFHLRPGAL